MATPTLGVNLQATSSDTSSSPADQSSADKKDHQCILGICGKAKDVAWVGIGSALALLIALIIIVVVVKNHQEAKSVQAEAMSQSSF